MDRRLVAGLLALVSVVVTWWVWGSVKPRPIVSDEQSYALQAEIFATGRWAADPPPVREAFEQSHVLTAPRVASKFPPGHALLLSAGALAGNIALVPLGLTALTAALIFLLTARLGNTWCGAAAVLIWLSDPIGLRFRPTYLSEVTTEALWLLSFWALMEWRRSFDRRWLLLLAAFIGWGAFTRPLTMLAFAVPVGALVIRDAIRARRLRDLGLAVALGITMLAVIPLWAHRTTGDWRLTPIQLYQREYLPYDKPGFGVDTTPPRRPLNAVNRFNYAEFHGEHVAHTPSRLPAIAFERLQRIAAAEWGGARLVIAPFVVIGLFSMPASVGFALACSAALFAGYLTYGHYAGWTVYYFEGLPVLAVIATLGMARVGRTSLVERVGRRPVAAVALAALAMLVVIGAVDWRRRHAETGKWYAEFDAMVARLPRNPTVLFVRYVPRLEPHPHVVRNAQRLEEEWLWVVNDMGAGNVELMRRAPGRIPLVFDVATRQLSVDRDLMRRAGMPADSTRLR